MAKIFRSKLVLLLFVLFISCNENRPEKTSGKPDIIELAKTILSTNKVTSGDPLNLQIQLLKPSSDSLSITHLLNNKVKLEGKSISIHTDSLRMGKNTIISTVKTSEGTQQLTTNFVVLSNNPPRELGYTVLKTFPHDPKAYTQGLLFHNNILYESTGQNGASGIRKVDLKSGTILASTNLDEQFFGEGITIINNKIVQLTWQNRTGFVYDLNTFEKIEEFNYTSEGWGLTNNDQYLFMSDGSNTIHILEPSTYSEIDRIEVFNHLGPVMQLNELEYINGKIYANVYQTYIVVIIDPKTGKVEAQIDFSGIQDKEETLKTDVMNGIAYNQKTQELFVTGKWWPKLLKIRLVEK